MGFGPCEDPSGGGMAATDGVPPIGVITSGDLVWEGLHESSKQSSGAPPFDGLGIRCFVFGNGAGASSTAATVDIMVEGDACWEQNVAANVDELSVRYDPASDSIRLSGSHRVTAFWSVSLSAVLTPVRECGAS